MSIDEVAARLRRDHQATLLAVSREGVIHANPDHGFLLQRGDDLVVVAESIGVLQPLRESSALV
jgi:voltage-gated potassium channel